MAEKINWLFVPARCYSVAIILVASCGQREPHGGGDASAVDLEVFDEAELDDRPLEVGIFDRAQGLEDLLGGWARHGAQGRKLYCSVKIRSAWVGVSRGELGIDSDLGKSGGCAGR